METEVEVGYRLSFVKEANVRYHSVMIGLRKVSKGLLGSQLKEASDAENKRKILLSLS